jgi:hypothetical protein
MLVDVSLLFRIYVLIYFATMFVELIGMIIVYHPKTFCLDSLVSVI